MNILLHICCAPCEIYPVESLRRAGHTIAGYFYNPNIHPYSEYLKRRECVEKYSKEVSLNVIYAEYDLGQYLDYIVEDESYKDRCPICWWYRMKRTAAFAKENGFDAFTTTLLGSPYQEHGVLKSICEDVAKEAWVKFYYEDFMTGFQASREKARSKGIYMQNYCGCLFSEKESIEKREGKK